MNESHFAVRGMVFAGSLIKTTDSEKGWDHILKHYTNYCNP